MLCISVVEDVQFHPLTDPTFKVYVYTIKYFKCLKCILVFGKKFSSYAKALRCIQNIS